MVTTSDADARADDRYDLITVGRVNMDLFSRDVGAPFESIESFDAMVGGSPSNIAIAGSRLGLRTMVFTAVGDDRVGRFVLHNFQREGVDITGVPVKEGKLTSLALLGNQPPADFPLSFYREDPADIHLTVDDAAMLPISGARMVQLSGDAFARGTCADAARFCAERARQSGVTTILDLDLRPTDWAHPSSYGLTLRSVFPLVDVLVGTEEELFAVVSERPEVVMAGQPIPTSDLERLDDDLARILAATPMEAIVIKRGAVGVTVLLPDRRLDIDAFPVEVVNTVGAGDAFAAGLIRSRLRGMDWASSTRFAAACGALEVTRHGCSKVFPTEEEVLAFLDG